MLEAFFFDIDGVRTYRERWSAVVSGAIRTHYYFCTGILVGYGDFRIGNTRPRCVSDEAGNLGPVSKLGMRALPREDNQSTQQQHAERY